MNKNILVLQEKMYVNDVLRTRGKSCTATFVCICTCMEYFPYFISCFDCNENHPDYLTRTTTQFLVRIIVLKTSGKDLLKPAGFYLSFLCVWCVCKRSGV